MVRITDTNIAHHNFFCSVFNLFVTGHWVGRDTNMSYPEGLALVLGVRVIGIGSCQD